MSPRRALALGASLLARFAFGVSPALAQDAASPAAAADSNRGGIEEIVVTARKREESIQDIPIAVTAISADDLETSNIDDVSDIQFNVPNLNFTKTNFSGAGNLSVRGVGNLAISATSEPGTGIHVNTAPFPGARIFETEFYDVDRIEVLRGPQGTLFGRSAPGGALNVYTKRPQLEKWGGYLQGEYGDYNHGKARAALNVPLGENFALRLAGYYFSRDGITHNLTTGEDIDDRNVYALRGSLAGEWDDVDANLMVQWFAEDDHRSRIQKQACTLDTGSPFPFNIGCSARDRATNEQFPLGTDPINYYGTLGFILGSIIDSMHVFTGGVVPRYLPGDLGVLTILLGYPAYAATGGATFLDDATAAAFGLPPSTVFGAAHYGEPDQLLAGSINPPSLRNVRTPFTPLYEADELELTFEVNWDLTEKIRLTSVTGWHRASVFSQTDYLWVEPGTKFAAPRHFDFPDSKYGGTYDTEFVFDESVQRDKLFTQEVRVATSFDGRLDFTAGASFVDGTIRAYYNVWAAILEAAHDMPGDPFGICSFDVNGLKPTQAGFTGSVVYGGQATGLSCHDYLPTTSYYKNETTPTKANEYAVFGEVYAKLFEKTRLTVGARYSDIHKHDHKRVNNPVTCQWSGDGAAPCALRPFYDEKGGWTKVTWKVSLDQRFDLPFAPDSLVYATVSTGFKGGGFNPAVDPEVSGGQAALLLGARFRPEEITAYEVGYKGILFESLLFNATAFYYDYKQMQISKIQYRTAVNENFDAEIKGVEIETLFQPSDALRLDLNVSWLDTEITRGTSIDGADPTAGRPGWVAVKQYDFSGQNAVCNPVVQTAVTDSFTPGVPGDGFPACLDFDPSTELDGYVLDGFAKNLSGKQLPNTPAWSIKAGAQYAIPVGGWEVTPRVDFYWHGKMFGRFYNLKKDRIGSWQQIDAQLRFAKEGTPFTFELWAKNLQDNDDVTGHYFTDPTSSNFTNLFLLEPRTFGGSLRYTWGESEL